MYVYKKKKINGSLLLLFALYSDAIVIADRSRHFFAGTKETTSYRAVYSILWKVQHAHAGVTAARNRRTRIDAGRISIYAGHVIFFYRAADLPYTEWPVPPYPSREPQ